MEYDPDLARRLKEDPNPYAVIKNLGLRAPQYRLFSTIGTFLTAPEESLRPLQEQGITSFYAGARTSTVGLSGFRNDKGPLTARQIVPFLEERVQRKHYASYNLRIAEFLSGICVVAQISRLGIIDLDIARGILPPLTSGQISPEYIATNEPTEANPTGKLLYYGFTKDEDGWINTVPLPPENEKSTLNTAVRTAIWEGLCSIPSSVIEPDIRIPRLAGRYELAVVNHEGVCIPIFGDAQPFGKTSVE